MGEVEGDVLQVVQVMQKEYCNSGKYGHLIEEVREVLLSGLEQ
jgi:hypothetical protein